MSLAGKRVVVVVGTSGMGTATVRAARRLGAEVVSASRRPVAERNESPGSSGNTGFLLDALELAASIAAQLGHSLPAAPWPAPPTPSGSWRACR